MLEIAIKMEFSVLRHASPSEMKSFPRYNEPYYLIGSVFDE